MNQNSKFDVYVKGIYASAIAHKTSVNQIVSTFRAQVSESENYSELKRSELLKAAKNTAKSALESENTRFRLEIDGYCSRIRTQYQYAWNNFCPAGAKEISMLIDRKIPCTRYELQNIANKIDLSLPVVKLLEALAENCGFAVKFIRPDDLESAIRAATVYAQTQYVPEDCEKEAEMLFGDRAGAKASVDAERAFNAAMEMLYTMDVTELTIVEK